MTYETHKNVALTFSAIAEKKSPSVSFFQTKIRTRALHDMTESCLLWTRSGFDLYSDLRLVDDPPKWVEMNRVPGTDSTR